MSGTHTLRSSLRGMMHTAVMRYSPYNIAIKAILDSGVLGDIINVQHIEPVGFEHFAHSYVRGNWRNEESTSFSLMTKCCHDLDIVSMYMGKDKPVRLSSFGSLTHFKPSKKPKEAGAATRCTECAFERKCPYSAKKIYLEPLASGAPNPENVRDDRAGGHEGCLAFLHDASIETILINLSSGNAIRLLGKSGFTLA